MKTRRVAFYGKGGIGKSTIASNVSALLAMQGKKVLHIGCDPKADSTRLLCKERIKTVLEVLEEKDYPEREDLVYRSESGVWCVESGGPEAGNGCAGMGIITAMKELKLADFRKEIYTQNMSASDSENWKAFCRLSEDICRTDERSVSRSQNKAEEALPIPLNVDEIEKFGMELSRKLEKL